MEQDITCKKEKERFFSYLGSLGLGITITTYSFFIFL